VAALYLQTHQNATPQQVRDALYAATTKGVVTGSNTTNNHLLYSPAAGFGGGGTPTNSAPVAAFTPNCTNLSCTFTDQSTDDNNSITSRSWNFGDGNTSTATNPQHTYATGGTYRVTLLVTDAGSLTNSVFHDVNVSAPTSPSATLTGSGTKTRGTWSTTINWSGFGAGVSSVDIYRNGSNAATRSATPSTFSESGKGGGTFVYKVCAQGSTTVCTNEVTITL
jgi:serine protease